MALREKFILVLTKSLRLAIKCVAGWRELKETWKFSISRVLYGPILSAMLYEPQRYKSKASLRNANHILRLPPRCLCGLVGAGGVIVTNSQPSDHIREIVIRLTNHSIMTLSAITCVHNMVHILPMELKQMTLFQSSLDKLMKQREESH